MAPTPLQSLLAILKGRRSIRRWRPDPVPRQLLESLIEAASWAPSASNRQDWFFSVVACPELKQAMAAVVTKRWQEIFSAHQESGLLGELRRYTAGFASFSEAPVVVVVSALKLASFQRSLLGERAALTAGSRTSAAMAAQNLLLAAHAAGLGACCMSGVVVASAEIAKLLELRRREVVCLITLGYPDEEPSPPPRRPVAEISRFFS